MATPVEEPFFTMLDDIESGRAPGLGPEAALAYKEAIRKDLAEGKEPNAARAFLRSVLAQEVPVSNLEGAKMSLVIAAEQVGFHLHEDAQAEDRRPWYGLMQEVFPQ